MTHPTPIFNEYIRIFDDCAFAELSRSPAVDQDKIAAYVKTTVETLKVHTFFSEQVIAQTTGTIFRDVPIRDYVLGVSDRFLITLTGNEHISYLNLTRIIAGFAAGNKNEFNILERLFPGPIAKAINPDEDLIIGALRDNRFLIVPLMHVLGWTQSVPDQPKEPSAPQKPTTVTHIVANQSKT